MSQKLFSFSDWNLSIVHCCLCHHCHSCHCKLVTFLPASPKAKAGLGVQSLRLSVRPSVRPKIMSSQLLWNYWSNYNETWYVDRTSYVVMHIGRKFWSPHFCWSYVPWNLENIRKSTNNLSFLCQFFINEITASDAGPDIIRSQLSI